jgi:hypothetical protein
MPAVEEQAAERFEIPVAELQHEIVPDRLHEQNVGQSAGDDAGARLAGRCFGGEQCYEWANMGAGTIGPLSVNSTSELRSTSTSETMGCGET